MNDKLGEQVQQLGDAQEVALWISVYSVWSGKWDDYCENLGARKADEAVLKLRERTLDLRRQAALEKRNKDRL